MVKKRLNIMLNKIKIFMFIFCTTTLICSCAIAELQFNAVCFATSCVEMGNCSEQLLHQKLFAHKFPQVVIRHFCLTDIWGIVKMLLNIKLQTHLSILIQLK